MTSPQPIGVARGNGVASPGVRAAFDWRRRRGRRLELRSAGAPAFLILYDRDDLVVAPVAGNRERSGGAAMRPDTLSRVSAHLHQKSNHFRPPLQHGVVKRAMLVVLRDVEMNELGASRHHRPDGLEIAAARGLDEPLDRHGVRVRRRITMTSVKSIEQLLGLTFDLIEVGTVVRRYG
jgi:hypothetical protein